MFDILQPRHVGGGRRSATQNGLQFRREPHFNIRMPGDQIPGPSQRRRGGFVSGGEERDHFIAQLTIAHPFAIGVGILGLHHARKEIAARGPRLRRGSRSATEWRATKGFAAAVGDDAVDQLIDLGDFPFHSPVPACRHPFGNRGQVAEPVDKILHEHVDGAADLFEIDGHIDVQQCFGDDGQRQLHHLGVQVERLLWAPLGKLLLREGDDDRRVGFDLRPMKRGLHQPPLPQPERAATGHQSLAERTLQELNRPAFDEMPVLGHQHLLDQCRIADQHRLARPEFHPDHRAMLASAVEKKREPIAPQFANVPDDRATFDPRRMKFGAHVQHSNVALT